MRAVIIDDEDLARDNMRMLLQEYCPKVEVVGMANGIDTGEKVLNELKPDIVFLDIRMPSGAEGFDLLNRIEKPDFLVVFVTAFKDYAIDAFKVNAVDYILKPIDITDLTDAVEKVEQTLKVVRNSPEKAQEYRIRLKSLADLSGKEEARITINHATGVKVVKQMDICYLQADGNCTRLYFKDGSEYLDTRTLKVYEDALLKDFFIRVHKSYIINIKELKEYSREDGNFAVLANRAKIPISRLKLSGFLARVRSL